MPILKFASSTLIILIYWLLSSNAVQAQDAPPTSPKLDNSLLWKITGKGIKPSYLFGTIHIIGAEDYIWTPSMDKAFKKTKKLVTEINMSNQFAMAVEMMQLAPMKENKTLQDIMSKADYDLVKKYFTEESNSPEAKMTFELAQKWQPMLLMSLLYPEMLEGDAKMYEMELTKLAKIDKMKFEGLETVQDQISVFHTISYKEQAEALVESIKALKKGEGKMIEDLTKLITYYKQQDVDGLLNAMGTEIDEMGNQEEMLDNRNKKWIPKIIAISQKMPTFYAVGAGHLGGPNGVIRLLRAAGYKVTAVK